MRKTSSLLAVLSMGATANAATLYWDNDTDASNNLLDGTGLGGAGTWNTTDAKWWDGVSVADQAWVNGADDAVFLGTAGAIVGAAGTTARTVQFNSGGNWSLSGVLALTGTGSGFNASGTSSNHVTAAISGTSLTKTGPGNVSLHVGNSFQGLVVNEGTITATPNGAGVAAQLGANPASYNASAILIDGGTVRTFKSGAAGSITAGNQGITVGTGGGTFESIDTASAVNVFNANLGILTPASGSINLGGNTLNFLGNHPVGVVALKGPGTLVIGDASANSGYFRPRTTAPTTNVKYVVNAGGILDVDLSLTTTELSGSGVIKANTAGRVLTVNQSVNTTFSGIISSQNAANSSATHVGLTKLGNGTLTLSGNNTSTGTFTAQGGTLAAGHNNAFGPSGTLAFSGGTVSASGGARTIPKALSFPGNVTIAGSQNITFTGSGGLGTSNSRFTINNSAITTFSGVLSGAATLEKMGTGRLVLSGNNTFTGLGGILTNGAGTLFINGTGGASTVVATNVAGATFSGNGTLPGTLHNSGTITAGNANNTIANLTIGTLVNYDGSIMTWNINAAEPTEGTAQDIITVTGALTFEAGNHTINVAGLSSPLLNDNVDRSYRIATAAGGITASGATFTVNKSGGNFGTGTYLVRVEANDLYLDFIHPAAVTASTVGQSVNLGDTANFSVTATGSGTLSYQWKKDGDVIDGATDSTYSVSNVQLADAGTYSVDVSNTYGTATASGVLAIRPTITVQPLASTNSPGDTYTFTVEAEGSGTFTYQWYKDGALISGATLSSLTINPVQGVDAAEELGYHVVVANNSDATATSTAALLRVTPEIITPLAANLYAAEGNVVLPIEATGTTNLSYFWYKGSIAEENVLSDDSKYSGTDTDTLTLTSVVDADTATYYVVVSNIVGYATNQTVLTVSRFPAINGQPQSLTKVAGDTATFTVEATGLNIQYQWRKGGDTIPDATTSALTLNNVQTVDEGSYDVVISNVVDDQPYSVTSSAVSLTVFYPLTATGPGAVTVNSNLTAVLEVDVTSINNGTITYQWRKGGSPLSDGVKYSGVNTDTLSVLNAVQDDAGTYELVLSAFAGSITNSGTLTVIDPPVVTVSPVSRSIGVGTNTTFTVTVVGTSPSYQWLKDGSPITDATGSTYTITGATLADEDDYSVTVSNSAGSDTSAEAHLAVYEKAVITTQPENEQVDAGQTAEFTVGATGRDIGYIWRRGTTAYVDDSRISGANTDTLAIAETVLADSAANITVVITNVAGAVTSSVVSLVVNQAPVLVAQPSDLSVRLGTSATFSFAVTGNPLSYQWYKNGLAISGATASSYTDSSVSAADYGFYHAVVTNPLGTLTSDEAILSAQYTHEWEQAAGTQQHLGTTSTERGIAYNPFTQRIYVVTRAQGPVLVAVLDAFTGDFLYNLDMTGITGGTFALNRIGVADDGQIYGCSLNTANTFKVYRWASEGAAPTEVYSGPGFGARWGDIFAVRGSGNGTQILAAGGANETQALLLKTTTGGSSFTATAITTTPAATAGEFYNGFIWGAGNTFYTMFYNSGTLKHWSLDTTTGEATLLSSMTGFDTRLAGISMNAAAQEIYGFDYINHRLQVYDISGSVPAKKVDYRFPGSAVANSNGSGNVVYTDDYIIGLESNNGMLALRKDPLPTVTGQPQPTSANAGNSANFSATASQTLVYTQWQKDGASIAGATTTTLTLNNVVKADEGNYGGILVSLVGPVKSGTAALTVVDPYINGHPQNLTVGTGTNAVFTVNAAGTGLTYEWRRNGSPLSNGGRISGADTASLTIAGAVAGDEDSYDVVVTGTYGSLTSSSATLAVEDLPTILASPASQTRYEGQTATFSVSATSNLPLTYQWFKDNAPIGGATANSYTTPALVLADNGSQYKVEVSNTVGTVSATASLTVNADAIAPVLKLVAPKANAVYLTEELLATGTALDVAGVSSVQYSLNGGSLQPATILFVANGKASNWTANLNLTPGTNSIVVSAADPKGNQSTLPEVKFFYHAASPLLIQTNLNGVVITTNGVGTVLNANTLFSGNNTNLFVGRTYTLKAVESGAPSYILTNWTATWEGQASPVVLQTNNLVCTFEMKSNMVINANFIDNPFYRFGGTYLGLFSGETVNFGDAGYVQMKVTPKLTFSAKLLVDGNAVAVSGKLKIDGTGNATSKARFKAAGKPELTVDLALDFVNATETVSGTVSQGEDWTSDLLAHRIIWSKTNVLEQAQEFTNAYTMLLPGFTNGAQVAAGTGSGAIKVDVFGKVVLSGVGSDMHPIKQATFLSKDGYWPMFSPMYKVKRMNGDKLIAETRGFAMGWLQLTNSASELGNLRPEGEVHLIKTGWVNELLTPGWTNAVYTEGFTNSVEVQGSRWSFDALNPQNTLPGISRVLISFLEGELGAGFQNTWDVTPKATFAAIKTNVYQNFVKAALVPKTGVFKGVLTHPDNNAVIKYQGVMLQDTAYGEGAFVGPSTSGRVTVEQAPE